MRVGKNQGFRREITQDYNRIHDASIICRCVYLKKENFMHMLQQPWEGMPRMTVGFTGRVLSGFAMNFMIEYRDNMREFMVLWSNKKEEGKQRSKKSSNNEW